MKKYMNTQESNNIAVKNIKRVIVRVMATLFLTGFICLNSAYSQNFRIVKSGPSVSNPGETITYVIAIRNSGVAVSDAVITDHLPSGNLYTYVNSKPAGDYNAEKNTIKWDKNNNPDLVNFANGEIYLIVTVKAGADVSGNFVVPDKISKLTTYTTIESQHLNASVDGNMITTNIPKAGGAILPVE
jgi:uncharacterized repeat protein (TIGR01451 family)